MRSHDVACLVYGGHKSRFGLFKRILFPTLALQSNQACLLLSQVFSLVHIVHFSDMNPCQ